MMCLGHAEQRHSLTNAFTSAGFQTLRRKTPNRARRWWPEASRRTRDAPPEARPQERGPPHPDSLWVHRAAELDVRFARATPRRTVPSARAVPTTNRPRDHFRVRPEQMRSGARAVGRSRRASASKIAGFPDNSVRGKAAHRARTARSARALLLRSTIPFHVRAQPIHKPREAALICPRRCDQQRLKRFRARPRTKHRVAQRAHRSVFRLFPRAGT